jgi:hypothetical protein
MRCAFISRHVNLQLLGLASMSFLDSSLLLAETDKTFAVITQSLSAAVSWFLPLPSHPDMLVV